MNEPPAEPENKTLGHGDHWKALGLGGEALTEYLGELMNEAANPVGFHAPWPGGEYAKVVQMHVAQSALWFVVLSGIDERERQLTFLSAYPKLAKTEDWVVKVDEVSDDYGPYEGVVVARAPAGHSLKFFVPHFLAEAEDWKTAVLVRVALTGLALKLERFDAKPVKITEGPRVEEAKAELRAEGKHQEADDPDFHVTILMDRMRTLYSLYHDHHQIIGRVMAVTAVSAAPKFPGWLLEIECLPDEAVSGCRLPVYVFPPALGDRTPPRKGDLVGGVVWLQGSWVGGDPGENAAIWKNAGGECPPSASNHETQASPATPRS